MPKPILAPHATLPLDKPRLLVLDHNAICDTEEATGENVIQVFIDATSARKGKRKSEAPQVPISFTLLRGLLWGCIRSGNDYSGDQDEPTLREAGTFLRGENLKLVTETVGKMINDFFQAEDKGQKRPLAEVPKSPETASP